MRIISNKKKELTEFECNEVSGGHTPEVIIENQNDEFMAKAYLLTLYQATPNKPRKPPLVR